jgi:hypothetical protein
MRWKTGKPATGTITAATFLLASIVYSLGSIFHLFPHGVRGEWYWGYHPLGPSLALLFPVIVASLICYAYTLARSERIGTRLFLGLCSLLHFLFVLSFQYLYPSKLTHLVATIRHPTTTGHFQAAKSFFPDVSSIFSSRYAEILPTLPTHSHTHLPGPVLCYRLSIDFFRDNPTLSGIFSKLIAALGFNAQDLATIFPGPAHLANAAFSMAMFYLVLLSLAVVPVYLLAVELFDKRVATLAVPLWILVPATVVFFPQFDLAYPVFSAASLLFLIRHVKRERPLDMVLCSVTISLGIFLSFAFITSIILCGITYALFCVQNGRLAVRELPSHLRSLSWFALPAIGLYAALYWLGSINVLEVFSVAMGVNAKIQGRITSLHWPLFYTWYDYFSFASLLASMFFLRLMFTTGRDMIGGRAQPHTYALAAYVLLLASLVFSGLVTAEAGRIWIFLMPLVAIFAAKSIDEEVGDSLPFLLSLLFAAFLQVVVFKSTYGVMFDGRKAFGGL